MRQLDQVAQHSTPFRVSDDARGVGGQAGPVTILPGPADFSQRVAACPLRYVLSDDLVAICTEVALAGGDQLSACLDLIHLPGRDLWIEWSDAARDRALAQLASNGAGPYAEVGRGASRAGALVSASPCGRRGLLRTFWSDNDGVVTLAPMETHLDLDRSWPAPPFHASVFAGGLAEVGASDDPDAADLFDCMRFRFDEGWSAYYRRHQLSAEQEQRILRSSLGAVARDMPMILAFSLLLGARSALATHPVERSRLNHHRRAKDKPPLLDHVHVTCPLITQAPSSDAKALQRYPARGAASSCPRSSGAPRPARVLANRPCARACVVRPGALAHRHAFLRGALPLKQHRWSARTRPLSDQPTLQRPSTALGR